MEALKQESSQELVVLVTRESDGYTFRLHPLSAKSLLKNEPKKRLPTISVAYDVRADLEQLHGPMFEELVPVLTGLSLQEVRDRGGIRFVDAATDRLLFSLPAL